jgi:protein-L-isoaspartate(D-aspartate) O-methyltransferase
MKRPSPSVDNETVASEAEEARWSEKRARMVQDQLVRRGIVDRRVLAAMAEVPRHQFVPPAYRTEAYADYPIPIGSGQTISQPYIVALCAEIARIEPGSRVLEIGTGCGYQCAVLAELGAEVFTLEILPELALGAQGLLSRLGYVNVKTGVADGFGGWPEYAPYDAIIVAAAPEKVPEPLSGQLKDGGRLVIPVGREVQHLLVVTREGDAVRTQTVLAVRFVPMTGHAEGG